MYGSAVGDPDLVACPDCDLLQRLPELAVGRLGALPALRQGAVATPRRLAGPHARPGDRRRDPYVVANAVPMLGLSAVGHRASTTVLGGARQLWHDGQQVVAVLVLFTAVVAPALQIGFMLAIVLGARRRPAPRWVGTLLRYHPTTRIWSMIEVMMLGVLVALIKIADYATVIPGTRAVRARCAGLPARRHAGELRPARSVGADRLGGGVGARRGAGAGSRGRGDAVTRRRGHRHGARAPELRVVRPAVAPCTRRRRRVAARAATRRSTSASPRSLQRTWALLIAAAAICYVPANLLPVLTTTTAAGADSDTILQGVVLLWSPTGWPLSLIVLVASVMIPIGKIVALAYLLLTVQRGSIAQQHAARATLPPGRADRPLVDGRRLRRHVHRGAGAAAAAHVGRPAPGLLFFAAVVVLTMLAAESFDPRLIWDHGPREASSRHA